MPLTPEQQNTLKATVTVDKQLLKATGGDERPLSISERIDNLRQQIEEGKITEEEGEGKIRELREAQHRV